MIRIDTVVIGAGHAGLAMSRALREAGRDHVVLEQGDVGDSWRRARWDSLTLLTPAWMNQLPGWDSIDDPDEFLTASQFAQRLGQYAVAVQARVLARTRVLDVRQVDARPYRYRVTAAGCAWLARSVVLATGPGGRAIVPQPVADLEPRLDVVSAAAYRNPAALRPGGVLVIGASASGVQIADELVRAGRRVLLAAGGHTRVPRRYRGMDIYFWLKRTGSLDRSIDELPAPHRTRTEPSLQVVGRRPEHRVDLAALSERGVEVLGHWIGADGPRVRFADDLPASCADAERRMRRLLAAIDADITGSGLEPEVLGPDAPAPFVPPAARTEVDLRAEGIASVVLATGYRTHLPWLRVPVLDVAGRVLQRRGVTPAPGLFTVGQRFQNRRSSGLIAGAQHDVAEVVAHLTGSGSGSLLTAVAVPGEAGTR
ncbi:MAG: NAD(P)/FAD-dependent oxidoreductase [Candidatus Nanopelagicales bacterium]